MDPENHCIVDKTVFEGAIRPGSMWVFLECSSLNVQSDHLVPVSFRPWVQWMAHQVAYIQSTPVFWLPDWNPLRSVVRPAVRPPTPPGRRRVVSFCRTNGRNATCGQIWNHSDWPAMGWYHGVFSRWAPLVSDSLQFIANSLCHRP